MTCKDCVYSPICKLYADFGVTDVPYDENDICRLFKIKIDLVGVVHGRWIKRQFADEPTAFGYRCSECHLTYDFDTNYCPNCGADMRGDKNG